MTFRSGGKRGGWTALMWQVTGLRSLAKVRILFVESIILITFPTVSAKDRIVNVWGRLGKPGSGCCFRIVFDWPHNFRYRDRQGNSVNGTQFVKLNL